MAGVGELPLVAYLTGCKIYSELEYLKWSHSFKQSRQFYFVSSLPRYKYVYFVWMIHVGFLGIKKEPIGSLLQRLSVLIGIHYYDRELEPCPDPEIFGESLKLFGVEIRCSSSYFQLASLVSGESHF